MTIEVTVRSRAGQATAWLEVAYDGLTPPEDLFDDLRMIGWRPPSAASPPRSAIDWDTPDPTTGTRFTVRNWRVEGQVVEPPAGSASRGAWTPAERRPFLVTLDGVLRRHGVFALSAELGTLPPPPAASPPAPPAPSPPPAAVAPPTPAGVPAPIQDPTPASTRGDAVVCLVTEVDDASAAAAAGVADHLGLAHRLVRVSHTTTQAYRGSTYESTVPVLLLEVRTPVTVAQLVVERLQALGLHPSEDPRLPATAGGGGGDPTELDGDEPPFGDAVISLVVDPARRRLVDEELTQLGLAWADWGAATRQVVQRYRGSEYLADAPALRVTVTVPPLQATAVARALALAAGVDADDPSACTILRPPVPEPTGDEPTGDDRPRGEPHLTLVSDDALRDSA
jgi:hypothetical protein